VNQEPIKDNLKKSDTWLRGLFVLLFILIFQILELVIVVIALLQFLATLFAGKRFAALDLFSQDLAKYTGHVIFYITYQSETKPFPFREWCEEGTDLERT